MTEAAVLSRPTAHTAASSSVIVNCYRRTRTPEGHHVFVTEEVTLPLAFILAHRIGPAPEGPVCAQRISDGRLVRLGPDLFAERTTRLRELHAEREVMLPAGPLPVVEKCLISADALHLFPLDGAPRKTIEAELGGYVARAATVRLRNQPTPAKLFSPPFPPLAIVVRDVRNHGDEPDDAAFSPLLRRPLILASTLIRTFPRAELEQLPYIRSGPLHRFLVRRSREGVFHPAHEPDRGRSKSQHAPLVVCGHPDPNWSVVARLAHRGLTP